MLYVHRLLNQGENLIAPTCTTILSESRMVCGRPARHYGAFTEDLDREEAKLSEAYLCSAHFNLKLTQLTDTAIDLDAEQFKKKSQ